MSKIIFSTYVLKICSYFYLFKDQIFLKYPNMSCIPGYPVHLVPVYDFRGMISDTGINLFYAGCRDTCRAVKDKRNTASTHNLYLVELREWRNIKVLHLPFSLLLPTWFALANANRLYLLYFVVKLCPLSFLKSVF